MKLEQLECLRSEIPPATPWLPVLVIQIRSKVKTRQSQSYKFKKNAKNSNYGIFQEILYVTHLLKLLDKLYRYEIDPTRTVGVAEQTRDAGRMDGVKPIYPPTTSLCWGYDNDKTYLHCKNNHFVIYVLKQVYREGIQAARVTCPNRKKCNQCQEA